MQTALIRVAIVEDDAVHREQFRENMAADEHLALAGEFWTVQGALAGLVDVQPHVVLVDLGLPDGSGFDVIRHTRSSCPDAEVMVVSVFGGESNLSQAIEAGATGYLLKDCLPADFNAAIRALRAGESPISPPLARLLLQRLAPTPASPTAVAVGTTAMAMDTPLSRREVTILEQVARGIGFAEIAETLFISPHTVKTHVKSIYRKLEAHSRPHAVYIARQRGWISA